MQSNRAIRIIKGAERGNQPSAEKTPATNGKVVGPAARESATGVASWVKEFRQRRRPDPRRAFAGLFADQATPLNSLT
jgi:hypothetical protein